MEERKEELKDVYSQWSTERLKYTLNNEKGDYEDIAIQVMQEELKRRGELDAPPTPPPTAGQTKQTPISLKSKKKIVDENACYLCKGKFLIGEDIAKCEKCGEYYHQRCWEEHDGCAKPGCSEDTKKCPMCGETIKAVALKCKHCGEYLDKSLKKDEAPVGPLKEATDSLKYSLIGIFCIGFILGPIAVVKGIKALNMIREEPRYEGKGKAIAGIIIGSLECLLYIFALLARLSEM
jgi:hypothetical protein